jgi:hypothetical protein
MKDDVVHVYAYTEAIQNIAVLFEEALTAGEVKIRRDDGKMLVTRPEPPLLESPLDVEGLDLGSTTSEFLDCIHEGRREYGGH